MELDKLTDSQIAALTIVHEAGNQGPEGLVAVGNIIKNRLSDSKRFGGSIREICLAPKQFSCWIPDNSRNYRDLQAEISNIIQAGIMNIYLEQAFYLFEGIIAFKILDNTKGSNHYLTTHLFESNPPSWAKGKQPRLIIRDQVFFRL